MNRLTALLNSGKKVVSIFVTAGFPTLEDTLPVCGSLESAGADLIEIGFPFSDPVADGPVIQASSHAAIRNGMTLPRLFQQLEDARKAVSIPLILMGYLNPVLQFGMERFCERCRECQVDGVILPDLPFEEHQSRYRRVLESNDLHFIYLVSPSSSDERIRILDEHSTAFLYAVSSHATTGGEIAAEERLDDWLVRLESLQLRHPILVGFGISGADCVRRVHQHARGAIIGSALIRRLESSPDPAAAAAAFVRSVMP